jgi:RHS repeat-associated protein
LSYLKSTWKKDFFKFTGKEELQGTGYIDFGARLYDPIVPRFTTLDPLAELSRRFSPTVYGNNNSLRFIDPDGMQPKSYTSISGYYSSDLGAGGEQDNEAEKEDPNQKAQREDDKDKGKKKELPTLAQAMASPHLNPNGDGINPDYTIESTIIGGRIFKPVFGLLGKVWGGIFGRTAGKWITTNESMSVAAAEYQSFITGRAANESYLLKGVKFDGIIDDVLVDAKSGYGSFVNPANGKFHGWFTGVEGLVDQARRQLIASEGTQIQWYFQNNAAMQATQKLFNQRGVQGIELIFKSN